jgi:micrococcal nuclease
MGAVRTYPATVTGVHDGDSATVQADLGWGVWRVVTVRLSGINAIELSQPGGKEARDHLLGLMPLGSKVTLASLGWDKYGDRTDALLALTDGRDVCAQMVKDGYAAVWGGAGPRPTPSWPIPVSP